MDPRGTMAMKDDSFGSNWRPGASVEPDRKLVTGRRSFFRRGAAAAASAVAAATFGAAKPSRAIRTICLACIWERT